MDQLAADEPENLAGGLIGVDERDSAFFCFLFEPGSPDDQVVVFDIHLGGGTGRRLEPFFLERRIDLQEIDCIKDVQHLENIS